MNLSSRHLLALLLAALSAASSSLTAQNSALPPRLEALRTAYEAAYQKEVAVAHHAGLADLHSKYTAALDRALSTATQAGQLETAVALRDEKTRVKDNGPLPADDSAAPEALKTLRLTYRAALANLELRRDTAAKPVKARYDQALEALQRERTKAGDLDGALAVKSVRDGLKNEAAPAAPTAATPAIATTPPPKPATPNLGSPAAGKYDPDAALKIMEWIFSGKGKVTLETESGMETTSAESAAEIPKGRLRLVGLHHDSYGMPKPPTPFPWELLPRVPTIRAVGLQQSDRIHVEEVRYLFSLPRLDSIGFAHTIVTLEAIEAMPASPLLKFARFGRAVEGGDMATVVKALAERFPRLENLEIGKDGSLEAVAAEAKSFQKLKKLSVQGRLDRAAAEKLASLPDLKEFTLSGYFSRSAEVDPEALVLLQQIVALRLRGRPSLRAGLGALSRMPKLTTLTLDTLDLQLEDVAAVASHKQWIKLALNSNPRLTDEIVAHLVKLKSLKELVLTKTGLTAAGIATLKKSLPGCKITQEGND